MNRIKELRKEKGLTLRELSEQLQILNLNISPDALSKYERNEREPKLDTLIKIAVFFKVSISYLAGIEGAPKELFDEDNVSEYCINLKSGRNIYVIDSFNNLLSKMQTKKAFVVEDENGEKYIVNPNSVEVIES